MLCKQQHNWMQCSSSSPGILTQAWIHLLVQTWVLLLPEAGVLAGVSVGGVVTVWVAAPLAVRIALLHTGIVWVALARVAATTRHAALDGVQEQLQRHTSKTAQAAVTYATTQLTNLAVDRLSNCCDSCE